MMWPVLKKSVKDFVLDESGSISKRSLIRLGIFSAALTAFAVPAHALSHHEYLKVSPDDLASGKSFPCDPDIFDGYHGPNADTVAQRYNFFVDIKCKRTGVNSHNCDLLFSKDGLSYDMSGAHCDESFWEGNEMPWVDISGSCSDSGVTEKIHAKISFDDLASHENTLSFSAEDTKLIAEHEHYIINHDDCGYYVYALGEDTDNTCADEIHIKYSAGDEEGGDSIVAAFSECFRSEPDEFSNTNCGC